jgi:hypothetical protein
MKFMEHEIHYFFYTVTEVQLEAQEQRLNILKSILRLLQLTAEDMENQLIQQQNN